MCHTDGVQPLSRPLSALKQDLLQMPGWLSALPPHAQEAFLSIAVDRRYPAGQTLLHSGDEDGGMIGIVSGVVEVRAGTAPSDASFFYLHYSGAWIGYGPIIGRPRTLDACTRSPVEALLLPRLAMQGLFHQMPVLWQHIAALAFDDMNSALNGCADLMLKDPERRVAALLLWLTGSRMVNRADGAVPRVDLSHAQLAELAGISRSGLSPVLDSFEERGCIKKHYGRIGISDPSALRILADG